MIGKRVYNLQSKVCRMFNFKVLNPIFSTLLLLFVLAFTNFAQNEWKPPVSRDKAKTPFAPKPIGGDNIFKGDAEKWLADAIVKIETGVLTPVNDNSINDYISQVGKNLALYSTAPKKDYTFVVLDDDEPNAMNVGGGRIYVNLGMLKTVESEDELAGILAHEIGHDAFQHAPKTVTRQLFWMKGTRKVSTPEEAEKVLNDLLEAYEKNSFAAFGENLLGFSRFDELEADRAAFYNLYKTGYNPNALRTFFKHFKEEEKKELGKDYDLQQFMIVLFGSHPPSAQRETAMAWESNFVKLPPKNEIYKNSAFDKMKEIVSKL